ncbi:hypothetical protein BDB00DRAFT_792912 [Zychaea mexicana]|uniref:uncharacterized protein n=1 Tax=Zychaea mexicana TaxID=64656 RepID=UPI0022FDD738|nr:uncharacterized protein BDB00DRAFT_792912 [Zychaea mexicana]KAI9484390.1 hypothetical protein BDB00DRAFT_792912 [Zychaea mexicana]
MPTYQRLRLVLLSLVLVSVTALVYRWHSTNDQPLRPLTTPAEQQQQQQQSAIQPASYDRNDPRIAKVLDNIDQKYCGGPCRFMLPVFIMEQESKAQMHFRQLAFMAGMLNRTIVLPNVGGSRLGACLEHDFTFYYSKAWAHDNAEHFSHISLDKFSAWVKERKAVGFPSTSQTFHVHLSADHKQIGETNNCFAPLMDSTGWPDKSIYLHDSGNVRRRKKYQKIFYDFFTEKEEHRVDSDNAPEVMSVYYDRRFPFIQHPASEEPIPYNERITNMADELATSLSPYLAVHWRTERAEPAEALVGCAESLGELIKDRSGQLGLTTQPTFFLLTDYPHIFDPSFVDQAVKDNTTDTLKKTEGEAGFVPASASFSPDSLTIYHHRAIHYLYSNFQVTVTSLESDMTDTTKSPANWTVLPVSKDLANHDSGVLGIIDKLMAIRADLFIAGKPGVCARRSSFTGRIVDERIARRIEELKDTQQWMDDDSIEEWTDYSRKGSGRMKNIIEYFEL